MAYVSVLVLLAPLAIVAALVVLWVRMFQHMLGNPTIPSSARQLWIVAFVIGNVVTAAYYYLTEYRT